MQRLKQQKIEENLKISHVYEPIVIRGKAVKPRAAVFPNVTLELWWGLGKGLILGVFLVLARALLKRATRGNGPAPETRKAAPADPADIW